MLGIKEKKNFIVLCGAYFEENNFGDVLLNDLLAETIYEAIPNAEIRIISNHMSFRKYCGAILRGSAFIYVPGGYMGYIEKWYSGNRKKTLQRIKYYINGILFSFNKRPMALIGGGIGPYEFRSIDWLLRKAVNSCQLITVRDNPSYELLKKVGVTQDIKVTADASQVLTTRDLIYESKESKEIRERFLNKKKVFVFCFNGFGWASKVITALDEYLNDEEYVFLVGQDSPSNRQELLDFTDLFPKDRVYTFYYKNPSQLLSIYSEIDVVITPKLHTGIVGCAMGKSVFCFSIQYDKSSIYYERIGYPERVYNYFDMSVDDMKLAIKKYINEKVVLPPEIRSLSQLNYDLLKGFLNTYVKK